MSDNEHYVNQNSFRRKPGFGRTFQGRKYSKFPLIQDFVLCPGVSLKNFQPFFGRHPGVLLHDGLESGHELGTKDIDGIPALTFLLLWNQKFWLAQLGGKSC
jgi:hypothetical protein